MASATAFYPATFLLQKKKVAEASILRFSSRQEEPYNEPFTEWELLQALFSSHDSTPGPDIIHNQFLQHLNPPQ